MNAGGSSLIIKFSLSRSQIGWCNRCTFRDYLADESPLSPRAPRTTTSKQSITKKIRYVYSLSREVWPGRPDPADAGLLSRPWNPKSRV
jgi:hypothetical protein